MALKAKKFVELVEEGTPVSVAAKEVGESVETLRTVKDRHAFGKSVQELLDSHGWMTPEIRKDFIRASQVKILDAALDAVAADPSDSKAMKIVLDATKLMGEDATINLYQAKVVAAPLPFPALPPGLAALVGGVVEVSEQPAVEKVPEGEQ